MDSQAANSRPHSRVSILYQCLRTVWAVLSGILQTSLVDDIQALYFWAAFMTLTSGTLLAAYIWLQPFYSHRVNSLATILTAVTFWSSATFFLNGLLRSFSNKGTEAVVLYYCGFVLMIPLVYFMLLWRRWTFLASIHEPTTNNQFAPVEVELKVRLMLFTVFSISNLPHLPQLLRS